MATDNVRDKIKGARREYDERERLLPQEKESTTLQIAAARVTQRAFTKAFEQKMSTTGVMDVQHCSAFRTF